MPCFAPATVLLTHLNHTLTRPAWAAACAAARHAFGVLGGTVPPDDPFFLLWAALDHTPCLAERLLAETADPGIRAELASLRDTTNRLLRVERTATTRRLVDVVDGSHWTSALACLAPVDGLVHVRFAGRPSAPRPVGPIAVFPPSAHPAVCAWVHEQHIQRSMARGLTEAPDPQTHAEWTLLDAQPVAHGPAPMAAPAAENPVIPSRPTYCFHFKNYATHGATQPDTTDPVTAFYRRIGPALHRWWRLQREAALRAQIGRV